MNYAEENLRIDFLRTKVADLRLKRKEKMAKSFTSIDLFSEWLDKLQPGLVPKKVEVERNGKTFLSTRFVRPDESTGIITKKVLVYRNGKPYERIMTIDPERMRAIGKLGFAATNKKLKDMMNDPNADPDDVVGLSRWFARRIKQTTLTYRVSWWRDFRDSMKSGKNRDVAATMASNMIQHLRESHATS